MKAINQVDSKLIWQEHPDPDIKEGEVLIAVKATAVNRADLIQRSGNYPPPKGASLILGLECAGVIQEVGKNTKAFKEEAVALVIDQAKTNQVYRLFTINLIYMEYTINWFYS